MGSVRDCPTHERDGYSFPQERTQQPTRVPLGNGNKLLAISQFTQCATFGLAMGPLRSPFEPPFKSPCRAVAPLHRAPPSRTPA